MGWLLNRWTACFLSGSTTPKPTFPTSALYQRHKRDRLMFRCASVCVCMCVCACTRAYGPVCAQRCACVCACVRVCVCMCVFLHTCHWKIVLLLSFSSEKERCHVFIRLSGPLWGFLPSLLHSCPFPPGFVFLRTYFSRVCVASGSRALVKQWISVT